MVEVLQDVGLDEAFRPQAELIDRTFEAPQAKLLGIAH